MNGNKRQFVVDDDDFANGHVLRLALRELRAVATNPRVWMAIVAVIGVLAVSGPFGTSEFLGFGSRLTYWGIIAVAAFFTGLTASLTFGMAIGRAGIAELPSFLLGGALAGLPVALMVALLNRLIFQVGEGALPSLAFVAQCAAISVAVSLLYFLVSERPGPAGAARPGADTIDRNPFFDRLERPIGTDLVCLQASDHYVEVTTAAGREMVLMRLADAVQLLQSPPPVDGMQTHRSWWVAARHVTGLRRAEGRLFVLLGNGVEVPVSRSRAAAVRRRFGRSSNRQ